MSTAVRRITPMEIVAGGLVAAIFLVIALAEPDVLEAPFASTRAVVFTFGGLALGVVAYLVMLRLGVPPPVRLLVVGIPLIAASWWTIEPYFVDDEVNDEFATSIAEQQPVASTTTVATPESTTATTVPAEPVLLGSGTFVGLAGHEGTGDAGVFRLADGSQVLRFENFDIENGPDLEVYMVPGLDQTDLAEGSIHLGSLRGNVGDQTYELPDPGLAPGPWTALVWCEAFTVEFVAASMEVA